MKKIVSAVALCCVSLLIPLVVSAEFIKTKIAVLDFQMQGDNFSNDDMGAIVAEWFTTALVREGRFDVIERRLLSKIFEEQKLALSGILDEDSVTQIGKVLGVKVIISGSVMKVRDMLQVNARIIDVESASIIAAESVKSPSTGILQDLIIKMSGKISKNFPLEGYIVNRDERQVTIDLGDRAGVKAGMEFIVYREGEIIKHPKTGEVLDVGRITTGRVVIKSVLGKISEAEIVQEDTPGAIGYGHLVSNVLNPLNKNSRLYVETIPMGAQVRILNADFAYHPGIELAPGSYQLKVTAPGYESLAQWIKLAAGVDHRVKLQLRCGAAPSERFNPVSETQFDRELDMRHGEVNESIYAGMLTSSDARRKKDAAKQLVEDQINDTAVLDIAEAELLRAFKENCNDRDHVEAMACFCEALGNSGNHKYKETLQTVTEFATRRKLRKSALEGLKKL